MKLLKNPENFDLSKYINGFRANAPTSMLGEQARNRMSDDQIKLLCSEKFFDNVGRAILSGNAKRLHIGNALFEYSFTKKVYECLNHAIGVLPIVLEDKNFDLYIDDEVAEEATEEQNNGEPEEETEGDEPSMTYYNSIYDYVQGADLSYYEIADGTIRETQFIEEITPADDPNFFISSDAVEYRGAWYRRVDFGETGGSLLLETELYETVYLVYIEESPGHYVTDGRVYETEEAAKASI